MQAEAPSTSTSSAESASESNSAPRTQATVVYRQPVLQNAGFGAAGGVQVRFCYQIHYGGGSNNGRCVG